MGFKRFFRDFGFLSGVTLEINDKCLSFDGDADRVVYFYKNSGISFLLCCLYKIKADHKHSKVLLIFSFFQEATSNC